MWETGEGFHCHLEFRSTESYRFSGPSKVSLLFIRELIVDTLKKMSPVDPGMWILESGCAFCCDSSDYTWDLQKPWAMPTSSFRAPPSPSPSLALRLSPTWTRSTGEVLLCHLSTTLGAAQGPTICLGVTHG